MIRAKPGVVTLEDLPDDGCSHAADTPHGTGGGRTERSGAAIPVFDETGRAAEATHPRPLNGARGSDVEVGLVLGGGDHRPADPPSADWLLSQVSAVLASSFDYLLTVRSALELSLPWLGDWAILDLLSDDADVTRASVARVADADREIARRLWRGPPSLADDADPIARVLRSGKPVLIEDVSDAMRATLVSTAWGRDTVRHLAPRSWLTVPLRARGTTIGALTFLATRSNRRLDRMYLGLAQQFADRVAIAVDNARLYEQVTRANEAKSAFLAVMSHELRTPLTTIIGYTELLADGLFGDVNEQQQLHLGRVRESSEHLMRIVDDVLRYARLEAHQERPQIDDVEVGALIDQVITLVRPQADRKRLALLKESPPGALCLRTDAGRLGQVLVNLLGNAVKFTDAGEVVLVTKADDAAVVFEVRDTGRGIPPAQLTRIFEPFWQADQRFTRSQAGTGLGLSVTKELVTLLGGTLGVQSTEGVGSTFTVRIPMNAFSEGRDAGDEPAADHTT